MTYPTRHLSLRRALAVLLLLGGCAAAGPDSDERAERQETLEDILAQPMEAEEYGTPRRCISSFTHRDFEALGDRYVLFEGPADRLWLNELRGRCPGLRHASALAFEMRGNQICEMDRFKLTDWFIWPRYQRWPWRWMDGIPCTLGKFQPVTEAQAEALRATFR